MTQKAKEFDGVAIYLVAVNQSLSRDLDLGTGYIDANKEYFINFPNEPSFTQV